VSANTLQEAIAEPSRAGRALAHFNVSELAGLKAVAAAAKTVGQPVIVGASEGEREFFGARALVDLVRLLSRQMDVPLYVSADHSHSLGSLKEALAAGFDSVVFDASALPFVDNVERTREAVACAKSIAPHVLIEGELGFIGSGSVLVRRLGTNVAVRGSDLPTPDQAAEFVERTGVDLLAPAVGNVHGMIVEGAQPGLDVPRIAAIRAAIRVPLVLHGGSGIAHGQLVAAIQAGMAVIHVNTELRLAWRRGVEEGLARDKDEIAPYRILRPAVAQVSRLAELYIRLLSGQTLPDAHGATR
jgi:fructose-bisphosphate aldolase, class II